MPDLLIWLDHLYNGDDEADLSGGGVIDMADMMLLIDSWGVTGCYAP